jgi:hypothetical protein
MNKTLSIFLASLFRNDAVMLGGKQPWYWALGLFLASTVIATLPSYTSSADLQGSDIITKTTYGLEEGLQAFGEVLYEENIQLTIVENEVDGITTKQLANTETSFSEYFNATTQDGFAYFEAFNRFRFYFQGNATNEERVAFIEAQLDIPVGSDIISFVFFGTEMMNAYVYNPTTAEDQTMNGMNYTRAFESTYATLAENTKLHEFVLRDVSGTLFPYEQRLSSGEAYEAYQARVKTQWLNFFDTAFLSYKNDLVWSSTTVMYVGNAIMAFFMSILVFIMTRGKTNPNHSMSVLEAFKIGAWSLFSPAVLTYVAGLFFPDLASTAFVLFVGLRMMWLSSSYLRPYQEPTPVKK